MNGRTAMRFLILLVAAFLLTALPSGCAKKQNEQMTEEEPAPPPEPEKKGKKSGKKTENEPGQAAALAKAPDFSTMQLNGGELTLSKLKARVIVLNFWLSVGSPQSEKQLPELSYLYDKYRAQGLEIVGISLDQKRDAEVKEYLRSRGISYPVCTDENYVIFEKYQPGQFPATVIIGPELTLVKKFAGFVSGVELEKEITPLLAK